MVDGDYLWDITDIIKKRLSGNIYNKGGIDYYRGRPIIDIDSPIDGGVLLGGNKAEALVADSKKYPKLRQLFESARSMAIALESPINIEKRVLESVHEVVSQAIPRKGSNLGDIISNLGLVGKKVAVDEFIGSEIGVCRHGALVSGVLLELFREEGIIGGNPSIDINRRGNYGHAWCRYTNPLGRIYIVDVSHNYWGELESASEKGKWIYERPTDIALDV